MILVDYSGAIFTSVHVAVSQNVGKSDFSKDAFRQFMLSQIFSYARKFSDEYGEMIFCLDSKNCWRKDIFKYYKYRRNDDRAKSGIDWTKAFNYINEITEEFKENLPYRFIRVDRLEGDDIIAILVKKFIKTEDKILIISNDKDLKQLHIFDNVEQYLPRKKIIYKESDPEFQLQELIIRGDSSDGIPNILSPIDSFYTSTKQKAVRKDFIKKFLTEGIDFFDDDILKRYEENKKLISFEYIPEKYNELVFKEYQNSKSKVNSIKYMEYCSSNNIFAQSSKAIDILELSEKRKGEKIANGVEETNKFVLEFLHKKRGIDKFF